MTTENMNPAVDENGFLKTDAPVTDNAAAQETPVGPAPKKRGRKSNAERAAMAAEQIEGGGSNAAAAAPKTRTKSKAYSAADVDAMANQLVGLHQIAAMMTGVGELQIDLKEGVMLSRSIVGVCEQYDLSIDGKTGAALQLFGVAAMVYVPRFAHFNKRVKAAKAAAQNAVVNPDGSPIAS